MQMETKKRIVLPGSAQIVASFKNSISGLSTPCKEAESDKIKQNTHYSFIVSYENILIHL